MVVADRYAPYSMLGACDARTPAQYVQNPPDNVRKWNSFAVSGLWQCVKLAIARPQLLSGNLAVCAALKPGR